MDWTKVADINFLHFLHQKNGACAEYNIDEFLAWVVSELTRRDFKFLYHMKHNTDPNIAYSVYQNDIRKVYIGKKHALFQFNTELLSKQPS